MGQISFLSAEDCVVDHMMDGSAMERRCDPNTQWSPERIKAMKARALAQHWPQFMDRPAGEFEEAIERGNADLFCDGKLYASWARPEKDTLTELLMGYPMPGRGWEEKGSLLWLIDVFGEPGIPPRESIRELLDALNDRGVLAEGEKVCFSRHLGERFGHVIYRRR